MKTFEWNKVNAVIAGATLALMALVILQGQWLLHSKNLIEEQFNQKLSMAMCMAVVELSDGPKSCISQPKAEILSILNLTADNSPQSKPSEADVREALDRSFAFYDLNIPYQIEIFNEKNNCVKADSPSCCPLEAVAGFDDQYLNITFPNRTQYILGQMSFMIGSSILILLFVSIVFWLATYYLIQQKKVGERNKDFFNNMAHEFKTPLTNIILASNLLLKKENSAKKHSFLNITKKEATKLMHQVERILYLSKMEEGDYSLNKEKLSLLPLIEEVIEDMAIQIEEQQAIVAINIDENLVVFGDKFHLSNAFRNIIDNALKYNNKSPNIQIASQEKDNGVLLIFTDNGIGISKANQSVVFEKFQRVGTGDVHNQKGFGLGLSYAKKVVELHKGFIQIVSEINKGSRFNLFLPRE
jgi:signal transduction histidine kinase